MTHTYVDLKLTPDRDIEFDTDTKDFAIVTGLEAVVQNTAITTFDETREIIGAQLTPTNVERLRGKIRDALRTHEFIEEVNQVEITEIRDESIDIAIVVDRDEDFHFTVP